MAGASAWPARYFVAVSQSGRSPDLVRTADAARAAGALCLAIVNAPESPLAAACELVIDIAAGPERSVAATKTVVAMLAASLALTAAWSGDGAMARAAQNLPERLARAVALDWSALVNALTDRDRVLTVGRGPGLAIASEAALKLSEVAGIAGLAYSSAELFHGPRVLAGPAMPVLGFVQDDVGRPGTVGCARANWRQAGGPVLAAGADAPGLTALPSCSPSTRMPT